MATHKLGFLKVNTSDDGLAFRLGNGKIHRLGLGKRERPAMEGAYDDAYSEDAGFANVDYDADGAAVASGYTGRFAQPSSGSDYDDYEDDYDRGDYDGGYDRDDYDDRGDYDDGYADDGYADDGYADDGYADDDGYDGGDYRGGDDGEYYDDGDYADGGYDDRYSDEDAGDYGGEPGFGGENPILRYIDENDWVTYALLVLLPPLGIYLLWRRQKFDAPIRWAVSAASGLWFVVLLILLISLIMSRPGDATRNPPITMNTPTPTVEATAQVSPEATDSLLDDAISSGVAVGNNADGISPAQTAGATVDALAPDVTATPLAGGNNAAVASGTVLLTATGPYYHNNANCPNIEQGVPVSNYTEEVAIQRGKTPCPQCYPGIELYYHTDIGTYYHKTPDCSGMKNATQITKEAAEKAGQKPCPVCITGEVKSIEAEGLRYADASTVDRSGINVYATPNGQYFHTIANCSGMENAQSIGLLQAKLAGKKACPKCAATAATQVWFTAGGERFHNKSDCSGMMGANQATLAEALIMGKVKCTECWGDSQISFGGNGVTGGVVYVYGTKDGQYYHTDPTCSGMQNASRVPLSTMLQLGRAACPVCASGADTVVYATATGQYYHSYANCSGMQGAVAGTQAQAMALGKQKCPVCWSNSGAAVAGGSTTMVYATQEGTYYHTNSTCSGMRNAVQVDLATAVRYGKKACPTCASAAGRTVYSTDGGQYYHVNAYCSGMQGARERTLQDALILGQSACPVCIGGGTANTTPAEAGAPEAAQPASPVINVEAHQLPSSMTDPSSGTYAIPSSGSYTAGVSGVQVWGSVNDPYFHGYRQHAGDGAVQVSLETAMNYGKTACPICLQAARTTVYAVRGGRYYHSSAVCAGTGAVAGSLANAVAYGLEACPVCVTRTVTVNNSNTFQSGASGIKVYATLSGSYFHTNADCAGAGASLVTLETALNYGKTPCPSCASSAAKTVYATGSDPYYHASQAHAGAGASAGYWAIALAMGKKACPVCIGGSEAYEESDVKYAAPADTMVYIDVSSAMFYYHRGSSCPDAGVGGGTGVTLDFAVRWGFHACPYCNPPTSVG